MTARTPFGEAFQSSVEGFQDYVLRVVPHHLMCPHEWSNVQTWLTHLVTKANQNRANLAYIRYLAGWDGNEQSRRYQTLKQDVAEAQARTALTDLNTRDVA